MTCTFLHVCFISVKMSKIYYSKLIICLGLLLLGTNRKQCCQEETIENVVHRLKAVSQKIKRCLIKEKRSNELSKGKRVKCCLSLSIGTGSAMWPWDEVKESQHAAQDLPDSVKQAMDPRKARSAELQSHWIGISGSCMFGSKKQKRWNPSQKTLHISSKYG